MLLETIERLALEKSAMPEVKSRAETMIEALMSGGNTCLLKKALYGLRQAGRQWYIRLRDKLNKMGPSPTSGEPCLYQARRGDDIFLLLIYVDDILVASRNEGWMREVKQDLMKDFEIKELGVAKHCLGLEISQEEEAIILSQKGYTLDVLARYGMEECNPISTPSKLHPKEPLEEAPASLKIGDWPYRELIGALMYLAVATRPDIANTVLRLAQFNDSPKKQQWLAAKRVLRYLAGTADQGLLFF